MSKTPCGACRVEIKSRYVDAQSAEVSVRDCGPGLPADADLQRALIEKGRDEQVVFITANGDIPMCARAMKAGASDFLVKPFDDADYPEKTARGPNFGTARQLASEIQAATANAGFRPQGGLTPDFLALSY